jgi:hypothetical protein
MRHRRMPKWANEAMAQPIGAERGWPVLSDMIGRLEVSCELCQRHGVYRVDRLMVKFGDVSIPEAILVTHLQLPEIWRRGLRPLWTDIVDLDRRSCCVQSF